jgi:Cu/Ag efflux protein CusF
VKPLSYSLIVWALLSGLGSGSALAQTSTHDHSAHAASSAPPASASADLSEGEVRRVDKTTGKVTLKHGEIKNLDMPPMTMVFQVKDPTWLDQVKVGSKVRFRAEALGSTYVLTVLEAVK